MINVINGRQSQCIAVDVDSAVSTTTDTFWKYERKNPYVTCQIFPLKVPLAM